MCLQDKSPPPKPHTVKERATILPQNQSHLIKQVSTYPTNSSTMETSNSGGTASTTWGAASFFCLLITTGAGEGLNAATQERGAFISDSHSSPSLFWSARPALEQLSCETYCGSAPQVLLLCRIWRSVHVPLQDRRFPDEVFQSKFTLTEHYDYELTHFKKGNHFVNNILQLTIRSEGQKKQLNIYLKLSLNIWILVVKILNIIMCPYSTNEWCSSFKTHFKLLVWPDVVERLGLVYHNAACGTPVADIKVLYNATFAN